MTGPCRVLSRLTLLVIVFMAQPGWTAAVLSVGSGSALPGNAVNIPVTFDNSSAVVSLQFDVQFNHAEMTVGSPTVGTALGSIHGIASSVPAPGTLRIVIAPSPDNAVIGSGQIGSIPFTIDVGASYDTKALSFSNVIMSDGGASSVAQIALNNGQIAINNDVNETFDPDGVPISLEISDIEQNARLTFYGNANQVLNLDIANLGFTPNGAGSCSAVVGIYNPNGSVLATATISASGLLSIPTLSMTGIYAIYIDPQETCTIAADVSLHALAGILTVNGPSVTALSPTPGQALRYRFEGVAGQYISLWAGAVSIAPGAGSVGFSIRGPDAALLSNASGFNGGFAGMDTPMLPVTGTYYLDVVPPSGALVTAVITLSSDVNGQVATDGTLFPLSFRPGQNARLTFSGTTGQAFGLSFGSMVPSANGYAGTCWIVVRAYRPDGGVLGVNGGTMVNLYTSVSSESTIDISGLPETGTYTLFFDPIAACTVTANISLNAATDDMAVNGLSETITSSNPGQVSRYSFDGVAGQYISLGASFISTAPANAGQIHFRILKPDGTILSSGSVFNGGGAALDTPALPSTGTYYVEMFPPTAALATATLTLSSDINGELDENGTLFPLEFRIGQNARLTFEGQAGQVFSLSFGGMAPVPNGYTGTCRVTISVYRPDGGQITINGYSNNYDLYTEASSTPTISFAALPVTGTYTLLLNPLLTCTFTADISIDVAVSGVLEVNGPSITVISQSQGKALRYSFGGSAGQFISLASGTISTTPANAGTVYFRILRPNGVILASSAVVHSGNVTADTPALPETGTYYVEMFPPTAALATATLTLSSDVNGGVATDGSLFPLSFRVGQNARLTFGGTAGQVFGLSFGSMTGALNGHAGTCWATVRVYKPDGSFLNFAGAGTGYTMYPASGMSPATVGLSMLPVTGAYAILIDPLTTCTIAADISLNQSVGLLEVNGQDETIVSPSPGQTLRYSFDGTVGQSVSLSVTSVSTAPTNAGIIEFRILKSDGATLSAGTVSGSGGATLNVSSLPSTGVYYIEMVPPTSATATATLGLSGM